MQLSPSQLTTLKSWLDTNASSLDDEAAAAALNTADPGGYKVWKSSLGKHDLIEQSDKDSANADTTWAIGGGQGSYVDRTVGERDAFERAIFNGTASCKPYLPNIRIGMFDVFSGTNAISTANRKHFWARGQRVASVAEKMFSVATVGGPRHDATNGSNPQGQTGNRGTWTNPDTLSPEGPVDIANVSEARQLS